MEIHFHSQALSLFTNKPKCEECEDDPSFLAEEANLLQDRVSLSSEADASSRSQGLDEEEKPDSEKASAGQTLGHGKGVVDSTLSEEEKKIVDELKARDKEVRAHEQAHKAAAGPYATGGPTFEYQTGPDGKRYAVGGEVGVDTSPVPGNPRATLQKARTLKRAALAPSEPSSQDRSVAAQAAAMEIKAQKEIQKETNEEKKSDGEKPDENEFFITQPSTKSHSLSQGKNSQNDADAVQGLSRNERIIQNFAEPRKNSSDTGSLISLFS